MTTAAAPSSSRTSGELNTVESTRRPGWQTPGERLVRKTIDLVRAAADGQPVAAPEGTDAGRLEREWLAYMGNPDFDDEDFGDMVETDLPTHRETSVFHGCDGPGASGRVTAAAGSPSARRQ